MKNNFEEESVGACPICEREMVHGKKIDRHHLIPKCKKGKETVWLHRICHQKIHSIWTEIELAKEFHVIDSIVAHPEMIKFVAWVKNKPIDFYDSNHDTNTKSKRRKKKEKTNSQWILIFRPIFINKKWEHQLEKILILKKSLNYMKMD